MFLQMFLFNKQTICFVLKSFAFLPKDRKKHPISTPTLPFSTKAAAIYTIFIVPDAVFAIFLFSVEIITAIPNNDTTKQI